MPRQQPEEPIEALTKMVGEFLFDQARRVGSAAAQARRGERVNDEAPRHPDGRLKDDTSSPRGYTRKPGAGSSEFQRSASAQGAASETPQPTEPNDEISRELVGVINAVMVLSAADAAATAQASQILAETRRQLYGLLAEA